MLYEIKMYRCKRIRNLMVIYAINFNKQVNSPMISGSIKVCLPDWSFFLCCKLSGWIWINDNVMDSDQREGQLDTTYIYNFIGFT